MSGPGITAGTQGFLFCDLRGYARFVDDHGDRAAAELLASYRSLVRSVIAEHAGAEIRTEGDSVYVVFPAASAAVEAGLGIVDRAADLSTIQQPIRVGVGIHAGETVASGEGPIGGAVNIAARVCGKAEAGEVLVTDTVRSLTRTLLPYRFVGLGPQPLKGIGRVPLYRVEVTSAGRLAHLRRRLVARRRLVGLVGLGLAIVLVAGTAAWAAGRPPDCLALGSATRDLVARIDPVRGCVIATYEVGSDPGPIAAGGSTVWVANAGALTVSIIDTLTGRQRFAGVPGTPLAIAATPTGDLVVLAHDDRSTISKKAGDPTGKSLALVSAAGGRIISTYPLPWVSAVLEIQMVQQPASGFVDLAVAGDEAVVTNVRTGDLGRCRFDGSVFQCGRELHLVALKVVQGGGLFGAPPAGTSPVAAAGGTTWVGDLGAPTLYRVTGDDVEEIQLGLHGGVLAVAPTASEVWLLRVDGWLSAYDPIGGRPRSIDPGRGVARLAASSTSIWVGDTDSVRRIDPATGATLTKVATVATPSGIAIAADGSVWVTIAGR